MVMSKKWSKTAKKALVDEEALYALAGKVVDTRAELECWLKNGYGREIFPEGEDDSPGEELLQTHLVSLTRLLSEAQAPSYICASGGEEYVLFKNPYWRALSYVLIDRGNTLPDFPEEFRAPHRLQ